eukprot:jgi/Hompol1/283/HPOL_000398-RA
MAQAKSSRKLSGDLLDALLLDVYENRDHALDMQSHVTRLVEREQKSQWTAAEQAAFESGVIKYGHELRTIQRELQQQWCTECHTYYVKYATPKVIPENIKRANRIQEKKRREKEAAEEQKQPKKRGRPKGAKNIKPAKTVISAQVVQKLQKLQTLQILQAVQAVQTPQPQSQPESEVKSDAEDYQSMDDDRPCAVCLHRDDTSKTNPLFKCVDCGILVHRMCFDITAQPSHALSKFRCDRCINGKTLEASLARHSNGLSATTGYMCSALSGIQKRVS